jgi:integrase
VDLRDAVSFHQLTAAAEGLSVATQRQYLYFESIFLRYLQDVGIAPALEALNEANVRSALLWYRQQPHPNASRRGEVGGQILVDILHLFARFLEREGVFADDPLRKLRRVKVGKRLRQPFTQAEIIGMWGACRQSPQPMRDETLFLLLLDTGMRIGEACGLTLDRVHLDQRLIVIGEDAKGKRQRLVPIGATDKRDGGRTLRALRRYIGERNADSRSAGRLFLGRDGYPLESPGGSQVIERLGQAAAVKDAGAHRLRHTFSSWYLVQYVGDELGLRRIIGHVSKEVLADYVHFAQTIIAERAGRASLAEQWLTSDGTSPVPLLDYERSRSSSRSR